MGRRERKEVKIEPVKVIHRNMFSGKDPDEYTITYIDYKVKTVPRIFDSEGKNRHVFATQAVYLDTPENRELLKQAQELEIQRNELNKQISELLDNAERLDFTTLHERAIKEKDNEQKRIL